MAYQVSDSLCVSVCGGRQIASANVKPDSTQPYKLACLDGVGILGIHEFEHHGGGLSNNGSFGGNLVST